MGRDKSRKLIQNYKRQEMKNDTESTTTDSEEKRHKLKKLHCMNVQINKLHKKETTHPSMEDNEWKRR